MGAMDDAFPDFVAAGAAVAQAVEVLATALLGADHGPLEADERIGLAQLAALISLASILANLPKGLNPLGMYTMTGPDAPGPG